ncbi:MULTISPECIES: LysR family transcriptional regulator [unclassified Janthinobacterium]|uniref:LysR family transcriptional regulator n=1 Tax=unclassified Janthinobacterium TaxID=2610881 RepID=UPI001611600D|nr:MULTISPECIES: LysR family transcriptional regulator [unclassified Janthinobacterium]MBB5606398.1 LysR family transcriptional regulator for bpeEF and oprC [Janthinobacterium sp. S3T4]MBB5611730.1 LysR family transcriptional regulator for bpeEF and oprC [Janthinobacterium sp. S3M3]
MDRIQAMQVFLRVVETNSFNKAAETLSMAPSSVTSIIKSLESHLQVRLLHRTTRSLSLTPEGERYYQRSRDILQAIDDTESDLQHRASRPRGRLRVDMPGTVARALVLPRLKEFFALYPDIHLMLGMNDRPMDLVQEGIDCVLRTGELRDSSLVARRLGAFQWITCGAPAYFEAHGEPQSVDQLREHQAVQYFSGSTGRISEFHFLQDGKEIAVPMAGQVAVNDTDSYIDCCLHGYGLIQLAAHLVREDLASGKLREVLAGGRRAPVPISLVYPHNRHLSPAVRVFTDWLLDICTDLA